MIPAKLKYLGTTDMLLLVTATVEADEAFPVKLPVKVVALTFIAERVPVAGTYVNSLLV